MNVKVLDLVVDVDIVLVQNLGVVERLQDGLLNRQREEGVLVGRLISADKRLKLLLFGEIPVKETEIAVVDVDGARDIDGLAQGCEHLSMC